jgi:cytochrome oxidase Cu insertion factor (SCO1/SenC/PrrC family)
MRSKALSLTAFCLLLGAASVPGASAQPPDEKTGLNLGAKAPDFTLKDQGNKDRSLAEFLKKGKVALVFFRSASW